MIEIILSITTGISIYLVWRLYKNNKRQIQELKDKKLFINNIYKKHGRVFEKFAPFANNFPVSKDKFHFLGQPIDGIAFEDDKIVFIEIKTGNSNLTTSQRNIRNLIEEGKVEFKEVRYG